VSDAAREAIAALEDYLRRYPSGHFAELAQVRLDALLAREGERRVVPVAAADNPYSKGTIAADLDYRRGDRYEFAIYDGYTGVHERDARRVVTNVTDLYVIFNGGGFITDLLGNIVVARGGAKRVADQQMFPTEYAVGRKWTTRYEVELDNGQRRTVRLDVGIVGKETVEVPAGRFDAFRVEASGFTDDGGKRAFKYWAAPDRVRVPLIFEQHNERPVSRKRRGGNWERQQLLSFSEASRQGRTG
jgi:hypothetical protein